jgi:hypothetical protein
VLQEVSVAGLPNSTVVGRIGDGGRAISTAAPLTGGGAANPSFQSQSGKRVIAVPATGPMRTHLPRPCRPDSANIAIPDLPSKVSLAAGDYVMIADTGASNALKAVLVSRLPQPVRPHPST